MGGKSRSRSSSTTTSNTRNIQQSGQFGDGTIGGIQTNEGGGDIGIHINTLDGGAISRSFDYAESVAEKSYFFAGMAGEEAIDLARDGLQFGAYALEGAADVVRQGQDLAAAAVAGNTAQGGYEIDKDKQANNKTLIIGGVAIAVAAIYFAGKS